MTIFCANKNMLNKMVKNERINDCDNVVTSPFKDLIVLELFLLGKV